MSTSSKKDEILDRLLAMASAKWGTEDTEAMRSSFEAAAQAITVVDTFEVTPEEEANPNPIRSLLSADRERE